LKGPGTVVAAPDGRAIVNTTGGSYLAVAGTGDVLSGVAAALLARGLPPFEAAAVGAWVHGAAADRLAARHGSVGMLAGDLADEIGPTLSEPALSERGR
jgi:NAD(P)H-hydrate repair Nnr-like enzyme with NAD(P)H-hydrate dehydratase domain